MIIGYLETDLSFPAAQPLKDKRQRFNISATVTGDLNLWQSGRLSIVTASNEQQHANEVLSKMAGFVERFDGTVMQNHRTQFI